MEFSAIEKKETENILGRNMENC